MKKNLKKLLPLLLILILLLGACASAGDFGGQEPESDFVNFETFQPSEAPAETAEPSPEPTEGPSAAPEPETTPAPTPEPTPDPTSEPTPASTPEPAPSLPEDGSYTTKEDVALYLHLYGHLPDNFITKKEAQDLGWSGGSLEKYAPGKCIGGDYFGNYEGLLPKGKNYRECDIDTLGAKSRGAKRIIYSDDGCIYYTDDHYESFTLLYGEE